MRNSLLIIGIVALLLSCGKNANKEIIYVKNAVELNKAIKHLNPGDEIVLANGIWNDVQIKLYGIGIEKNPITLRAEVPGKVFLEGESFLQLGGEHLIVSGLYFRNGYSPKKSIIRFKIGKDTTAFNSRVTNCVIEDFTKPSRLTNDHWVEFHGKHNMLDHCYISGKSNDGETLRVYQNGNKHSINYHQIVNNYFGPRPRKGGPRAETIRIGDSKTSMTPGYVNVSENFFDACNGEVEIISDKTNFNTFKNNVFYKCEGSLVLRHGNFTTVDGNIFIGGDESDFYGGIRVVNTGHWIINNYFYKINGAQFRSPLAVMNGIHKSQLNRYKQVTDAVVAHNTWVDCKSPLQISVGQNMKSIGVLPDVEIRSAAPIRTIIANNIIYNHEADDSPVVNHHKINGISFKNNLIDNNGVEFTDFDALHNQQIKMKQINDWLFVPEEEQSNSLGNIYHGYDFENKIQTDLFGYSRSKNNKVGAISHIAVAENFEIDKSGYGPNWYTVDKVKSEPNTFVVSSAEGELADIINQAKSGDIIELSDEMYTLNSSLKIDKEITLRSKGNQKAQLVFTGAHDTPAFEMNRKGIIRLDNIFLKGQDKQLAFAPLKENMFSAYNLFVNNCVIEDFDYILKATKGSFADSINFRNTTIKNCENGVVLAAEEKGDYNAEMVTFNHCEFVNIKRNVINFYRGGYDESTIGGILTLNENTFTSCGAKENSGILIKTTGIINVDISDNTFQHNPVKYVAVLWGIKNNHHRNNIVTQSGQIKVEEQQKLEILY